MKFTQAVMLVLLFGK